MDTIIEIVGDNQTFFRTITRTDLRDIAKTYAVDRDLQKAHDDVWRLSQPIAIESTGNVSHSVIDDSNDRDSCVESWLELVEELET